MAEIEQKDDFRTELEQLINRHSRENGSDTPDFVLAEYLDRMLQLFDRCVLQREHFHGRRHERDVPFETTPDDAAADA